MRKIITILICLTCLFSSMEGYTDFLKIEEFKKLTSEEKVKYINAIDKEHVMIFIEKLLINSSFALPRNHVKFLKNGEVLVYTFGYKYKKDEFHISKWKIEGNKLILWKTDKEVQVPFNMKEEWVFIEADFSGKSRNSFTLEIKIKIENSKDNGLSMEYIGKSDPIRRQYKNYEPNKQ